MLTFFEYLRQRAYESVLDGAQEALQALERDNAFDKPALTPKSLSIGDQYASPLREPSAASDHSEASGNANESKDDSTGKLPAPRLRHRPNRKGSRKK